MKPTCPTSSYAIRKERKPVGTNTENYLLFFRTPGTRHRRAGNFFLAQFLYVCQNALVLQATTFRGVVCASEPAFQHFHVFTAMQPRVGFLHTATSRERLQTSRTIVPVIANKKSNSVSNASHRRPWCKRSILMVSFHVFETRHCRGCSITHAMCVVPSRQTLSSI